MVNFNFGIDENITDYWLYRSCFINLHSQLMVIGRSGRSGQNVTSRVVVVTVTAYGLAYLHCMEELNVKVLLMRPDIVVIRHVQVWYTITLIFPYLVLY